MKRKTQEISTSTSTTTTSSIPAASASEINKKALKDGDVYSRVTVTNRAGRGSLAGWTACPLCNTSTNTKSQKKFSLGRGISMHLNQGEIFCFSLFSSIISFFIYLYSLSFFIINIIVHQPWNPGKAELARRERIRRRTKGMVYQKFRSIEIDITTVDTSIEINLPPIHNGETEQEYYERVLNLALGSVWNLQKKDTNLKWIPTECERQEWEEKVLSIARELERENTSCDDEQSSEIGSHDNNNDDDHHHNEKKRKIIQAGHDRNGCKAKSYKDSLPPFIKAASVGNLDFLKETIEKCCREYSSTDQNVQSLNIRVILDTLDRNASTAEHWAAGGGHLDCLKYIFELRASHSKSSITTKSDIIQIKNKSRKRDGKTCLHYAARNGHNHVIDYLLSKSNTSIDVTSNDGTTPLHLACYGCHPSTIKTLVQTYTANLFKRNDWGCGVGHWIAMCVQTNDDEVVECLAFLKERMLQGNEKNTFHMFGHIQKQGHTAVHKASQKLNRVVLQWLMKEANDCWTSFEIKDAGQVDLGGNRPSSIWISMGGDEEFASTMKEFGW